jgi:chitinase
VTTFAEQVGMGRISFWSLNRDQQAPTGALTYVSNTASSVVQTPFEFSKDFLVFEN